MGVQIGWLKSGRYDAFRDDIADERVVAFCDALRLFKLGYSWAGPVSLVVPYEVAQLRGGGRGVLVRLSMGLEAVADLQADLAQALAVLGG